MTILSSLLQSQTWTAEFRLLDRLTSGNMIGQCYLSNTQFESLFLSNNEASSIRRFVELTSSGGPAPIKLQIVVTQILVSSPRSYLLESIHEHSRLDISRITAHPAPLNNAPSEANMDIASSILGVMSSISQLKPIIDQLATVHPYVNLAWQIMTAAYNVCSYEKHSLSILNAYFFVDCSSPKTERPTCGCSCNFYAERDPLAYILGSSY